MDLEKLERILKQILRVIELVKTRKGWEEVTVPDYVHSAASHISGWVACLGLPKEK